MSSTIRLAAVLGVLAAVIAPGDALAQRSPSIPPPTPVPPDGSPSPYPTVLVTPSPSTDPPRVDAASAALADLDSGRILWEDNAEAPRPIASLTKIMTALLVIERTRPTEIVVASPNATGQAGAELGLQTGEEQTVHDLLRALLLQSANDAAVALAEHVAGTVDAFVAEMNARAAELRMRDTEYQSPSGLDDRGHSTARDLLRLASEAFLNPTFAAITATRFATVPAPEGDPRRLQNRNALLWLYDGAFGGKTGYTGAAGFCLVAAAERDGLRLATVVLGAPEQAFDAGAEILDHGFESWERETVVSLGEQLEPVTIEGQQVDTEAESTLSVLVPAGSIVDTVVEPTLGLSLPVEAGEPLGSLVASTDGRPLGETVLVAAEEVAEPLPPARKAASFWGRLWDSVSTIYGRAFAALGG
jgi:D-alanyl-D-alanine carboxypeptidase (penicillin-binding protein 5/6)